MNNITLALTSLDVAETGRVSTPMEIEGHGFLPDTLVHMSFIHVAPDVAMEFDVQSDVAGDFALIKESTPASADLISDGTNVSDGDTVTLDGVVYTFKDELADPYDVLIGENAVDSLTNLRMAINLEQLGGPFYGEDTELHPTVRAVYSTAMGIKLAHRLKGAAGNGTALATTATTLEFSSSELTGGVDTNNQRLFVFTPSMPGRWLVIADDGINRVDADVLVST